MWWSCGEVCVSCVGGGVVVEVEVVEVEVNEVEVW